MDRTCAIPPGSKPLFAAYRRMTGAELDIHQFEEIYGQRVTDLAVWHNNVKVFYQPLKSLLDQGVVSIHTSYSSERFPIEWPPAEADYATKLHKTYGFVGFRIFTGPDAAPAIQLFTADGKTMLSGRLKTWDEIDNAAAVLVDGVEQAAEAAKRTMAKAAAS